MENKEKLINLGQTDAVEEHVKIKPSSIRPSRSISGVRSIKPSCGPSLNQQENLSQEKR